MRLVFRYLKPYRLMAALCILLLFTQAICDLSLPGRMSQIVNVGIQQGGIDEPLPEALSAPAMELVSAAAGEEAAAFRAAYGPAGEKEAARYPYAGEIYLLREESGGAEAAYRRAAAALMASQPADTAALYAAGVPSGGAGAGDGNSAVRLTRLLYSELGMDLGWRQTSSILWIGLQMLLLTLAGAAAAIGVGFCAARIAAGCARSIRHDVFSRVESFSGAEFDRFSTASLITRTTNDVSQVQGLIMMGLRMVCYAPIMGIGGVVMALSSSVSMSWIIALGVLILVGMIMLVNAIVRPRFQRMQKLTDRLNLVARDNLSGMLVVRAFGAQKLEEKRFETANRDLTGNQLFVNRLMSFMMPATMLLMNGIQLIIVLVGARQIGQSALQVGDMMAFMQYAMQIVMAFLMISMIFIMLPRAAVSAERLDEVMETAPSIRDPENPRTLGGRAKGEIRFENVSFRYPGAEDDVLAGVSFTARPGQTTAFIGATGSGKSTLVSLIPRFYEATQGRILLDGVDIRELRQQELRKNIGFVPQKGVLFSGDVASNLRYGAPEAGDGELEEAAAVAQAGEFIAAAGGLHAPIAQGGSNVSGGQKQRLAIARALALKAPVYIFDDSFSALDFKTDAALRRALHAYTGESTVLIVAQRVSTIMNAGQIIVLEDGRIAGMGTHRELLKSCPAYQEIARSQLSEEELA
ncbi:MAG: ABC transporter ATP-binding protein [Provencibacterium sp.]|jgi:ATP-binding cassette subfamily B multidrug efflux pump|nr:ABC transporter ATP-binding protein [Provencibacterium sp.]